MKGKIRAIFVLPSLKRGGAEVQVLNLVNNLDPIRFDKHLFVFERQVDQIDRIDRAQVRFHHHPRRHKFDLAPIMQLARLIEEQRIDIVHCSLQIALFVGWLAICLAKHKPRLVLALHTTVNHNRRDEWFNKLLYQWLMRSCDRIICVCKAQESYWQGKYPFLRGRTTVIYNGVDAEWFDPDKARIAGAQLRERYGVPADAFVACCIAGFRPEKGHGHLLQAFKQVVSNCPNAYLLLAGDGVLRKEMELLAAEAGLSRHVIFLGLLSDVRPLLAASDVSVIASTAVETFSIAMLESLAMGVPMVATDIGGTAEAIREPHTGLLVPADDVERLAGALERMRSVPRARHTMGEAGRGLVMREFSSATMTDATARLFEEVATASAQEIVR